MDGVTWAEGPEHPRPRAAVARPRVDSTPPAPPWAGRAVVGIAIAGALVVVGAPLGLGMTLTLLAFGTVAAAVRRPAAVPEEDLRRRREPTRADRWRSVWWVLAAALAVVPTLRAATWVVVPCVLVALALASLGAGGGRSWGELSSGLAAVWARLPLGAVLATRVAGSVNGRGAALRGGLLAAGLLLVFVPLLMSADAAFAEVLQRVTPNLDMPVERALAAALFAAGGGALVYAGLAPLPPATVAPPRRRLSRLEWGLPLGALVVLLGAFVALQLATLFGGDRHVLNTAGLTYAQYARSGFAQLLGVAALTLAVVAAAHRWAPGARPLLAVLCLLTLVVLASALKRLGLYEDAYGFTRLRFAAHATLLWLGAIFALVLVARPAWLPRAALAITGATVLLFALADPDRRIADHNVERWQRTGKIDVQYARGLSADATPALVSLLECAELPQDGDGFNLARRRAGRACEGRP